MIHRVLPCVTVSFVDRGAGARKKFGVSGSADAERKMLRAPAGRVMCTATVGGRRDVYYWFLSLGT
jgi:hypothetical protein